MNLATPSIFTMLLCYWSFYIHIIHTYIQAQSQLITNKVTQHFCNINTNAMYITKQTGKLLRHQRFGHPYNGYLYKAGKARKCVPIFSSVSTILNTSPTCIRAKQTKIQKQAPEREEHNPNVTKPCMSHSTKQG